ncbi:PDZ domain-containing protein [Opitutia bacterium ISCC 51]|nr:PDZ domain-containing protein [Opitutae bacterium ISCC 51]QXD30031.1 PDZ domain-containing protein [Opitutae bacterium ISCC 52]
MKKSTITTLSIYLFVSSITMFPASLSAAEEEDVEIIIKKTKTVTFLGIETSRISKALRNHIDLPEGVGLTIGHIADDSGAAETDLKQFDILHKVDDQIIINQEQLRTYIRSKNPGDTVKLEILRKGKELKVPVKLGEREVSENRGFGNEWKFPNSMPNPFKGAGKNWNFDFDSEEFNGRMEEFSQWASEFGNRAMQFIPEVMIEQEIEDGSKRVTSVGRGAHRVVIRKNDLTAELTHEEGEKVYTLKRKDGEEDTTLYEGAKSGEEELEKLSPEAQALIQQLDSSESFDWKNMNKVMNEKTRIIINTGEDEASLSDNSDGKEEA